MSDGIEKAAKRNGAAVYSVFCGGAEVNDYYLTKEQAEKLAFEYEIDGYEDVTIRQELNND